MFHPRENYGGERGQEQNSPKHNRLKPLRQSRFPEDHINRQKGGSAQRHVQEQWDQLAGSSQSVSKSQQKRPDNSGSG